MPLDEEYLVVWLLQAEAWPNGMPATTALEDLGITNSDLEFERNRERAARIERDKEERSLEFNGRLIDPKQVDPDTLWIEIKEKLPEEVTSIKLGAPLSLRDLTGTQGHAGRGSSEEGGGGGRPRKVHPDKAVLIGFLGECAVYQWLKNQFPRQDIEAAWVSTYKSRVLPESGNDNLGYDFKIRYRNQRWYLEVKSHIGDPREFELSETEIRFASSLAGKKWEVYRIIYVSNVQNTSAMYLEILPNPFSKEGKWLRRVGQGLRYTF